MEAMNEHRPSITLKAFMLILFLIMTDIATGNKWCHDAMECVVFPGYTCRNNRCVCEPESDTGIYRCTPPRSYGERCKADLECVPWDSNLYCVKSETRVCRCRRGFVWDTMTKRCFFIEDDIYNNGKFDPVRDIIVPGIIIMTVGAMGYLGFKLFCNFNKLIRNSPEVPHELDGPPSQPATWVASYRVFSSLNDTNRPPPSASPFPLHPTPCMGLFVPSQAISASPPPYEEALKHKVILSSHPIQGYPLLPPYPSHSSTSSVNHQQAQQQSAVVLTPPRGIQTIHSERTPAMEHPLHETESNIQTWNTLPKGFGKLNRNAQAEFSRNVEISRAWSPQHPHTRGGPELWTPQHTYRHMRSPPMRVPIRTISTSQHHHNFSQELPETNSTGRCVQTTNEIA